MNEQNLNELLSAYLDGELTAPERAEVERALASSPAAQQKVEEYRRISELVRDVPRHELPVDFSAEVMQLAERRMLLAETAAAPVRKSRTPLHWALTFGAPLATAALLLIVIQLTNGPGPRQVAKEVGVAGMPQSRQATADFADDQQESAKEENATMASRSPANGPALNGPEIADRSRAGGEGQALSPEMEKPAAKSYDEGLQNAEVGRAIEKILENNSGEKVAVVKLYVVDRMAGLELVQVALEQNSVAGETKRSLPAPTGLEKDEHPPADKAVGKDSEDRREALFVVATSGQLSAALDTLLARKESVVGIDVAPSIELARLDSPSQERVQAVSDEALQMVRRSAAALRKYDRPGQSIDAAAGNAPAKVRPSASKPLPQNDPARSSALPATPSVVEKTVPADRGKPSAGAANASRSGADKPQPQRTVDPEQLAFSRQIVVRLKNGANLPEHMSAKKSNVRSPNEPAAQSAKQGARGDAAKDAPEAKESPAEQPVQVIIVIEQRSRNPDRPAPPDTPQPLDGAA